jgi:hypothetical protein
MIYLTGSTNDTIQARLIEVGIGLMCQPGNGYHHRIPAFPAWAADNGCFAGKWEFEKHFDWLDRLPRTALFAVSPDVYPSAEESLRLGLEYAPLIREMGFKVAVVAQTGAEKLIWPWAELDCLFVGGERTENPKHEWKTSEAAAGLCKTARNHGKAVHMGRVNSYKRLERARAMGCTSADGNFLSKGPNINTTRLTHFLRLLDATQPLPLDRFESVHV